MTDEQMIIERYQVYARDDAAALDPAWAHIHHDESHNPSRIPALHLITPNRHFQLSACDPT